MEKSIKADHKVFLNIFRLKWIHCNNKKTSFNRAVFSQQRFLIKNCHVNMKSMKKQRHG